MELTLIENFHSLNSSMFSFKQFRQYDFKHIEERTASLETHNYNITKRSLMGSIYSSKCVLFHATIWP